MNYESMTIRDAIDDLNRTIYLPAIQRELVWDTEDIELLFDSLMRDFPIGSFLFWKVKEENKHDWTCYEFFRQFDEDKPHNTEADLSGINKDIYLILDGQQRLSALNIGLKGSFEYFYYRWKKTHLYLNLLKEPKEDPDDPEALIYEFEFRESDETDNSSEYWYKVSRILDFKDSEDAKEDIEVEISAFSPEHQSNAKKLVGRLHSRIHTYKYIIYFEEKSQDYDKVVEEFIRANTTGEPLGYSDILLSTATAKWNKLNAREEINTFTDSINNVGNGFNFEKDFVLKGCLFLTDDLPIQYKIKNFTKQNLFKIEDNWDEIKKNIMDTIQLIDRFGFSSKNIVSAVALLPIAYYLQKLNKKTFINSTHINDVQIQNAIQKWLILVLIKNVFGGASDTKLNRTRAKIKSRGSYDTFPSSELLRTLNVEPGFSDIEIENSLNTPYKSKYSYLLLSLLYPDRDWKDKQYEEDHIFPKSEFTTHKLKMRGYSDSMIEEYQEYYNTIINLQLLTDTENREKFSQDFEKWINTRDSNFKKRHSIPIMATYSFDNFIDFIEERKEIIETKLKAISV